MSFESGEDRERSRTHIARYEFALEAGEGFGRWGEVWLGNDSGPEKNDFGFR